VVVDSSTVVDGSTVVVVTGCGVVVVVGATVVVVGSTVLTGAGGGSGSVVVVGSGSGSVGTGGRDGRAEDGGAVVGARAARAIGATPGGGGAVEEEDPAVLALDGATAGGSVATGWSVGSTGTGVAAGGSCGWEGTKAAEATIAASTEKVSPKATSMRRRGRRCSARWRGARLDMRLLRVRRRLARTPDPTDCPIQWEIACVMMACG
jgi:hypothetical protein